MMVNKELRTIDVANEEIVDKKYLKDLEDIYRVASNHCDLIRCKHCNRYIAKGFACIHCGSTDPR